MAWYTGRPSGTFQATGPPPAPAADVRKGTTGGILRFWTARGRLARCCAGQYGRPKLPAFGRITLRHPSCCIDVGTPIAGCRSNPPWHQCKMPSEDWAATSAKPLTSLLEDPSRNLDVSKMFSTPGGGTDALPGPCPPPEALPAEAESGVA